MQIYIAINIILIFFSFVGFYISGFSDGKKLMKLFSFFAFCFLVFFAGLRYEKGPDYLNYVSIFNSVNRQPFYDTLFSSTIKFRFIERGYLLFNNLLSSLKFSFHGFLLALSLVSLGLKYVYLKKYSKYVFLSLTIYYLQYYLNSDFAQIRQCIAISITLWASHFFFHKKRTLAYLIAFVALLFHNSALIFFPVLLLLELKTSYKTLYVLTLLLFLFNSTGAQSILVNNLDFGILSVDNKLDSYLESESYGKNIFFSLGNLSRLLFSTLLVFYEKQIKKYPYLDYISKLYLIGYVIFSFFVFNQILAGRLASYFKIYEIVLFANLIYLVKLKNLKLYPLVVFIFTFYLSIQGFKQINTISSNPKLMKEYQDYDYSLQLFKN